MVNSYLAKKERLHNGVKTVSSINGDGKQDRKMKRNKTRPLSYTIYKNKLKMDERLNVRLETIKILQENRN